MKWSINQDQAIYPQIVERFIKALISGEYVGGQKLPSVRDLAKQAAINPNTMQRAMAELEKREIVVNQRTSGKSISDNTQVIETVKKEYAKEQVDKFIAIMMEMGFSKNDILNAINLKLEGE